MPVGTVECHNFLTRSPVEHTVRQDGIGMQLLDHVRPSRRHKTAEKPQNKPQCLQRAPLIIRCAHHRLIIPSLARIEIEQVQAVRLYQHDRIAYHITSAPSGLEIERAFPKRRTVRQIESLSLLAPCTHNLGISQSNFRFRSRPIVRKRIQADFLFPQVRTRFRIDPP